MEPLAFSRANRRKGKAAMIAKANREVIIGKAQLKRKIKCLYYFKTLAELIKALNSKKELEDGIFSVLYQFIAAWQGNGIEVCVLCRMHL